MLHNGKIFTARTACLTLAVIVLSAFCGFTASADNDDAPIVVSICEADTANAVIIPDALMDRLQRPSAEEIKKEEAKSEENKTQTQQKRNPGGQPGWRVQVFSDNNSKTAKNEARTKEQTVLRRFPQYRTYKKYSAPYWRVRVGDFTSQSAADAAAAEMRRAFPKFAKEIRVVRDRVYPTE